MKPNDTYGNRETLSSSTGAFHPFRPGNKDSSKKLTCKLIG
jgi:hypothetical protein